MKKLCLTLLLLSFAWSGLQAQAPQPALKDFLVLTEDSPPGEYLGPSGKVTGPTAEYVRELMKRLGITKDIQLYPWARAYRAALDGPLTAVFETTRTPEREALFHWIGPIKRIQWTIFARKADRVKITSLEDLKQGGPIVAYRGDSKVDWLKSQGFSKVDTPNTPSQCAQMLLTGRVKFWMYSEIGMEEAVAQAGLDPELLEPVWSGDNKFLYIALSKDTPPALE